MLKSKKLSAKVLFLNLDLSHHGQKMGIALVLHFVIYFFPVAPIQQAIMVLIILTTNINT